MKELPINQIIYGDCLEVMPEFPDKSIDMILCDLPYGITSCKWDVIIPFEPLWEQYKRIIKDNGAIVLTATQPFTSVLITSNIKMFKYCWVWDKVRPTGFQVAKYRPMMRHEDIAVFCKSILRYNPIMERRNKIVRGVVASRSESSPLAYSDGQVRKYIEKYPQSILVYCQNDVLIHPTQKPVALFEYLIKTYTNSGETVLDNCIGSGTTAVACLNTGRKFIGIDNVQEWVDSSRKRIEGIKNRHKMQLITNSEVSTLEEKTSKKTLQRLFEEEKNED
jgi:site-specific DNA-methyltransferase (adenine-specific)